MSVTNPGRDPSNPLFVQFKLLNFHDLVDYNILQTMYKAQSKKEKKNSPAKIQKRFEKLEIHYHSKGTEILKKLVRTKPMEVCITAKEISLWNNHNN